MLARRIRLRARHVDLGRDGRHGAGWERARIKMLAPPSRCLIGGRGLRECLRPSRPANWELREGQLRFLP
jgi:hypothetical protein